jgi:hypothetical protein
MEFTVTRIISDWCAANNVSQSTYQLVVIHTSAQTQQTSGDSQFIGRPQTTGTPSNYIVPSYYQ